MVRKTFIAVGIVLALIGISLAVHAAKEKFVRTKPHVNVGTIGSVGPGEGATAILRLDVPSVNEDNGPACDFEGVALLSTKSPEGGIGSRIPSVERFEQVFEIEVSLKDSRDFMTIPLNLQAEGSRLYYLFEVLADDSVSMDQCGLDIVVDVFDSATGKTVGRHTPSFSNYRPQFYFRTTTGN